MAPLEQAPAGGGEPPFTQTPRHRAPLPEEEGAFSSRPSAPGELAEEGTEPSPAASRRRAPAGGAAASPGRHAALPELSPPGPAAADTPC